MLKPDSLYHLFSQVLRLHFYRLHMLLDKVGVYPGQPPMLFSLYKQNGQSQKELSAKLGVKPATITVMLKRMEKAQLVERMPDPEDQRVSRVYLTEAGREVTREVKEVMSVLDEECFRHFSEEEQMLLRRLFMQMRDNLAEVCDRKLV